MLRTMTTSTEPMSRALDGPDDVPAVGAPEHHGHAPDDLARPVLDRAALADGLSGPDVGDVADEDGRPRLRFQGHVADVLDGLEKADAADEILLFAPLEHVAADVEIVPSQRLPDVAQGEVVSEELLRVHRDVVLLDVTAEGIDLVDARDGLEEWRQDPVLDGPDLGQVFRFVHPGRRRPDERVLVDLAHGRGDGSHRDLRAFGDALPGLDQPLQDELAGEIDVDAVLEDDGHDREPRLRDRADLFEPGQAAHGRFDRIGDEPFDLGRRHARGCGQHFDLDVGHVREGVDGDAQNGPDAQADEDDDPDEDEGPLSQGAFDEAVDQAHANLPPGRPCGSRISAGSCPT
jgi:hypothetical protein